MKARYILPAAAALFLTAKACLLPEEIEAERHLAKYGRYPDESPPALRARQSQPGSRDTGMPIGTGNRFGNGTLAPQGSATDPRDMKTILTPDEITSGLQALATRYEDVTFFNAPYQTYENRTVSGIKIGVGEPRIYLQGGVHPRERGGPDYILYFLADLLHARDKGTGLQYGRNYYNHTQVMMALSAGIVSMPMLNPDGVAYDQKTGKCWHKNRNCKNATPDCSHGVGIDINRNFDALWNFPKHFNITSHKPSSVLPTSDEFHGRRPFSEPESQNAAWIAHQHPNLSWIVDIHSYGGLVLYGWADAELQTTDPSQNFMNPLWDGKRGTIGDSETGIVYKEYLEAEDLQAQL